MYQLRPIYYMYIAETQFVKGCF